MALLPVIRTWEEWRAVFTDPRIWRNAVAEICRRHSLPHHGEIAPGFPGSCAVFRVGNRVVVKLYPPMCRRDFHRERECYELLSSRSEVPIPGLLASGVLEDAIDWPYIATEFRQGRAIREVFQQIPQESRLAIARQVGRAVRAVHGVPPGRITSMPTGAAAWRAFLDKQKATCVATHQQAGALSDALRAEIPVYLASTEPLLSQEFRPCLLNGDLTEDHLLLVEEDGHWRISAHIDLADAEVGHPHYDWVALWFGMLHQNVGMMRSFMAAYDPNVKMDPAWRRLAMAYTLLHRFGGETVRIALGRTKANTSKQSLAELQDILWPPDLE